MAASSANPSLLSTIGTWSASAFVRLREVPRADPWINNLVALLTVKQRCNPDRSALHAKAAVTASPAALTV